MRYVLRLLAYAVIASGAVLMCVAAGGCAQVDNVVDRAKGIVIDCTKQSTLAVSNELGPLIESTLIESVDGDGKINFDPLKDLGKRFTADVGGCLVANAVERLLKLGADDPNAPQVSGVQVDKADLRQAFEQYRAERFGGIVFELANGAKL